MNSQSRRQLTLRESFALYLDRRLIAVFALGISSGFPWVLIGSAMSAWLKEAGLTRTAIGFFGSIFAVYAINFLWSPLVDRARLPGLHRRFGQRRSWILLCQLVIALACVGIAFTDPSHSLLWTSVLALCIAIASATQDIAIDAYRIDIIDEGEEEKIPAGSAMATGGWWAGYSLPGAAAFVMADHTSWSNIYIALGGFVALLMGVVMLLREPQSNRDARQQADEEAVGEMLHLQGDSPRQRATRWLLSTVVMPIGEFFQRNGIKLALAILMFIFLFKIGEAFLGRMSIVFYKEVGFSNTDIGIYSKLVGWWVTIIFAVIGGALNARFGLLRGLLIGGIAMASTNLMFSWIALVGPDLNLFALAVVIDGFTAAFATVTFVAFISHLTSRAYSATQYALMASLGNLARTTLSSSSGMMVDGLDGNWALFFIITALMVMPSLLLLLWIGRSLKPLLRGERSQPTPDTP